MKIKYLLSLLVCMLFGVQGVLADDLTLEEAKQKAATFLQQKVTTATSMRKVRTASTASQLQSVAVNAENLYVFNRGEGNGFVIMAKDDSFEDVLGYCDSGSIDLSNMPEALRDILQVYNYNVGMANKTLSKRARAPRKAPANLAPVKPLTRTYFNQSGAQGMYLPVVESEDGAKRIAPSGCVACATAQVIAYYQWPNTVKATSAYTMAQNNIVAKNANCVEGEWMDVFTPDSKKVTALPSYDINWDNIIQGSYDDYTGYNGSTNTNFSQKFSGQMLEKVKEIGRLYLYVCCTLPMSYYGYSGTGSVSANIASILPKYWGYKNQIKVNQRRNYTQDEWIKLLYEELSNKRLVVYAGTAEKDDGSTGAHTFIMDGYDGAGYWHVNWGWNGKCDGYFDFENLLPYGLPDDTDGYTVSRNGYVLHQHAITGIEPDRDGTATVNNGYLTAAYSATKNSFTSGSTTYGKTMIAYFENPNPTTTTNQVSWALLNDDGTINKTYYGNYRTVKMPKYDRQDYASNEDSVEINGKNYVRMYFAPLDRVVSKWNLTQPGTYKIVPICRKEGDTKFEDYRICEGADKYYFTVTVDSKGTASVTTHPQVKLSLQEIKLLGDQIAGKTQEIQVLVKNEAADEFAGMVRLSFTEVPEGAEKPDMRTASANILPGETCKVKFPIILNTTGEYTVKPNYRYRQDIYTPFTDTFTFEITSSAGKSANISTSFNIADNVEGVTRVGNRYYLTGNSLVGTFRVTNSGTASAYRCTYVQLYNSSNTDKASLVGTARIDGNIVPGYTVDLPFHFNNLDLTAGKVYYLRASCQQYDYGYASGGSTYQVLASPSLTYWNKDGEETKTWIEPDYTSETSGGWWGTTTNTYKYELGIPSEATAVDLTGAEAIMKKTSSGSSTKTVDDYTFTPSTNLNCLYFVSENPTTEVQNKLNGKNMVKGNVAPQITLTDGYDYYTPTDFTATNISYSRKFDVGNKRKVGGGWQSIVLPFEVQNIEVDGSAKKWFKSSNDDADFWVYQFKGDKSVGYGSYDVVFSYLDSETMQAHTPYIMAVPDASWGAAYNLAGKTLVFKATDAAITQATNLTQAGNYYSFVGTYENLTDQQGIFVLDSQGKSFTSAATSVSPFVAYLLGKDRAQAAAHINLVFDDDFVTAIDGIRLNQADTQATASAVYDLQGRLVSTKGLNSLPKGCYIINGKKIVK